MTPGEQGGAFLTMALLGVGLAAVHDLLCALRLLLRAGPVMTAAADLVFGVICAAGIIAAGLMLQVQITRGYLHAGTLCGAALYTVTAGAALRWAGRSLLSAHKYRETVKKMAQNEGKV